MKKRILAALLCLCLLAALLPTVAFAADPIVPDTSWYDESKTSFQLYDINDLAGLATLSASNNFEGKTITLMNDLTFAADQYWYDNTNDTDYCIKNFKGTFDGGNHTIYNLKFKNTGSAANMGLFQIISEGGAVYNLTLDTVTADVRASDRFGSIVHNMHGDASNCHVKNVEIVAADIAGTNTFSAAGAFRYILTTTNGVSIKDCSASNVTITCAAEMMNWCGGLLGQTNAHVSISNCTANNITFTGQHIRQTGGLASHLGYYGTEDKPTTVENCSATNVTFNAKSKISLCGGLASAVRAFATARNCFVENVTMTSEGTMVDCGGFALSAHPNSTVENCAASNITITSAGEHTTEATQNSTNFVGGFMPYTYNGSQIKNSTVSDFEITKNTGTTPETVDAAIPNLAAGSVIENFIIDNRKLSSLEVKPDATGSATYVEIGREEVKVPVGAEIIYNGQQVTVTEGDKFPLTLANPFVPPLYDSMPFTDVDFTSDYFDAIDYVYSEGFMMGVAPDQFAPDATLTRAMVWTILARMSGVDTETDANEPWYAKARLWAMDQGITDGTFPERAVTKLELVTMLWRFYNSPGAAVDVTGVGNVPDWGLEALRWAAQYGLIDVAGWKQPATRAETAVALYKA